MDNQEATKIQEKYAARKRPELMGGGEKELERNQDHSENGREFLKVNYPQRDSRCCVQKVGSYEQETIQKQERVLVNLKHKNLLRQKNFIKGLEDKVEDNSQNIKQKAQDIGYIEV